MKKKTSSKNKKRTKNQSCDSKTKKLVRHLTKLNKLSVSYLGEKIKINVGCPEIKKGRKKKRSKRA